ncbi:MAG: hypothetical protein PHV51_11205 [Methanosarcinaceae archaeon]|nr:hypothetical protein [Methanosarcinaceae archaeon]
MAQEIYTLEELRPERENFGGSLVNKKIRIILVSTVIVLCFGTILNFTKDPLLWGTAAVTFLFVALLFGIDPLSPSE